MSNGYDDVYKGDEQIRPMVYVQSQEIMDGDKCGESWTGTGGKTREEED